MPVGTIINAATAAAECAAPGAGNPDLSQVGGDYQNGCAAYEVTTGVGEPYRHRNSQLRLHYRFVNRSAECRTGVQIRSFWRSLRSQPYMDDGSWGIGAPGF
jgi:hypothetical protein